MKVSGIYQIQSKVKPTRIYIGSAIDIHNRWRGHLSDLRLDKHHSIKLQRHYNKYGESDLQFSILSGCDKDKLLNVEQFYLDAYKPYFNGYLIAGSPLGIKRSEEYRLKLSKKLKGVRFTDEHKRRISERQKGRIQSEETRFKISQKRLGMKPSLETREKLHEAGLKRHHSEETKNKMREINIGKGNPMYGKHASVETKIKMSLASKGKPKSFEHRNHMKKEYKLRIA